MSLIETGTIAHAIAGANLLARTADVWAIPELTTVGACAYDVCIQLDTEEAAIQVAEGLGIGDSKVEGGGCDGYAQFVRGGRVDGVTVRIVSCWRLDESEEAA